MDFIDYLTGHAQADAQRNAANAQVTASGQANNALTNQFNYGKGLVSPIAQQGAQTYATLGNQVQNGQYQVPNAGQFSFDPNNISQNPGFQFQLAQGQRALGQDASANGNVLGGSQGKQLEKFGQGLANTYENTFFNQAQQTNQQNYNQNNQQQTQQYQRMQDLVNSGLGQNDILAQMGNTYATQTGENLLGGAQAYGQGQIGSANAIGGQLGNLLKLGGSAGGMALGGYLMGPGAAAGAGAGAGGNILQDPQVMAALKAAGIM
jgi:hypothetical protein